MSLRHRRSHPRDARSPLRTRLGSRRLAPSYVFLLVVSASTLVTGTRPAGASAACSGPYWIPVVVHFVLHDDGTGNFTEVDDGLGDSSYTGHVWAEELIRVVNGYLENEMEAPSLPPGNSLPVPQPNWRFQLVGVEFHRDSSVYDRSSGLLADQLYGTPGGQAVDLYIQEDASDTSRLGGIATVRDVYLWSPWAKYKAESQGLYGKAWLYGELFMHEAGHLLSLFHDWGFDYCDDTPEYDPTVTQSNNMMSYGSPQKSLSPCQLARAHTTLSTYDDITTCSACTPPSAVLALPDRVDEGAPVWLNGSASTYETEYSVTVREFDPSGQMTGGWGYSTGTEVGWLDLHGLNYADFKEGFSYEVSLTVENACGASTDAATVEVRTECDMEKVPRIAFVSDRSGSSQIWSVRADGTGTPHRLTDEPAGAGYPVWSPGGSFLAYVTRRTPPGGETSDHIVIADRCGNERAAYSMADLFGTHHARVPDWSCDSRSVIFQHLETWPESGIAVLAFPVVGAFQTYGLRSLVHPTDNLALMDPVFTPDATQVFLNGTNWAPDYGPHSYLLRMQLDAQGLPTGPAQELVGTFAGSGALIDLAFAPSISMDGEKVIYNSEYPGPGFQDEELIERSTDVSLPGETNLTQSAGFESGAFAIADSQEIVFHTSDPKSAPADLYFLRDGTRNKVDIDDPLDQYSDHTASWWVEAPACNGDVEPPVIDFNDIQLLRAPGGGSIQIETTSEIATETIRVLRLPTAGGPESLVAEFSAQGAPGIGASYQLALGATSGSWVYVIEAESSGGTTRRFGAGGCLLDVDPGCSGLTPAFAVPALPWYGSVALALILVAGGARPRSGSTGRAPRARAR